MADEVPNFAWEELASHFLYIHASPEAKGVTDLFPRSKPTQGEEITAFISALARKVEEHSVRERSTYAATYTPPAIDDVLIDDETIKEVSPFFSLLHEELRTPRWEWDEVPVNNPHCRHPQEAQCSCLIPYDERQARALLRRRVGEITSCDFFEPNAAGLRSWEFLRTLAIHGKMEPIFKLCAHPENDFKVWWNLSTCLCEGDNGASFHLYEKAAISFICLNILRCFPEIWDPTKGRNEQNDYRLTKMYQHTVRHTTKTSTASATPCLAHCHFYGIDNLQFYITTKPREPERWAHLMRNDYMSENDYPEGLITYGEFCNFEKLAEFQPHVNDVASVEEVLFGKGLPSELVAEVMDMAEYTPKRKLKVDHDPFHSDNKDDLDSYLAECWAVMIRYDMFSKEIDENINWVSDLTACFKELFPSLRSIRVPKTVRSDDEQVQNVHVII